MALASTGCQRGKPAAAPAASPPAKVAQPVTESKLNTIELTAEAQSRLAIETAEAEPRMMRRVRPYGAEIVLPAEASVIVAAPVTGTLQVPAKKSFPHIGRKVTVREPLLELLPLLSPERAVLTPAERIRFAEARNTLAQGKIDADGQVQQTAVQVEAAQIALERAEKLLREKAGSARAVDEAKAQLSLAQKAHKAALARKKQVDNVSLDEDPGILSALTIESPMTGIVRSTQVKAGEIVAAGAALFEVMNDEVLWVKVPIYVGEADEIDESEPAELTPLDGRHSGQAIVARPADLPPTAVPLAAAVDLYFELENANRQFSPGERLTAHLVLKGDQERLVIPWSAVMHDIYGGQWVYEAADERKYVRRRVEVAWVDGKWAVLSRGLQPGAQVVIAGAVELAGTEFGFAK